MKTYLHLNKLVKRYGVKHLSNAERLAWYKERKQRELERALNEKRTKSAG